MHVLTLWVGPLRFAIDVRRVMQVVPRVPLRPVPGMEEAVAGLLDLGTSIVPVVDLGLRVRGEPCSERLSTRIVVMRIEHAGRPVEIGLVAERVTDLCEIEEPRARSEEPRSEGLGAMLRIGGDLMQWIDVDQLLTAAQKSRLFDGMLGTKV